MSFFSGWSRHKLIVFAAGLVVTVVVARFAAGVGAEEESRAESADAASSRAIENPVRQGPAVRSPSELGIGRRVPELMLMHLDGASFRLSDVAGKSLTVLAATSTTCPLSQKYLPTLAELANRYADAGVAVVVINPVATDSAETVDRAAAMLGEHARYALDPELTATTDSGLRTTTDVIVLDSRQTVIYQGAVDDQYGFGYSLDAPRQTFLSDAIDAGLATQSPAIAATDAPGCQLRQPTKPTKAAGPTYHREIARLVNDRCVECHRKGGVAPFGLESYDDVVAHSAMIRDVVERGVMPPWFAAKPHDSQEAVSFANDPSLTPDQENDLFAWIDSDLPAGDPSDAPAAKSFPGGWMIGQPDAVYQFAEPVAIKATGTMPYKNVMVPTDQPEDRWVQAIEIQPGDRGVVHHVIVSVVGGRDSGGEESVAEARGGYWAAYVPGLSTLTYPDGFAKRLPAGATLRFQMHYTPNGTATEDRTRIGLKFATRPPDHEVKVTGIVNPRFTIPPHADNHLVEATLRVPGDAIVMSLLPHAHLRGKACRYELTRRDGTVTTLLDIPHYDFNWQLRYTLAEPLDVKAGESIRYAAWYDNSAANPANPNPNVPVHWGPQTDDEMHLGYIEYYVPGDAVAPASMGANLRDQITSQLREAGGRRLFDRLDTDRDGFLSRAEVETIRQFAAGRSGGGAMLETLFNRLDANGDDRLSPLEASKLRQ